jgi:2-polyprenyl-6-methoxyphenol hydroxylase-like FAD-dependent oxidoreductase
MVSGGGLAGLTMRLALQRAGVQCDMFDLAPSLARDDTEEGLVIPCNAVRTLSDLGMPKILGQGTKLESWDIFGRDDKRIGGADLEAVAKAVGGAGEQHHSFLSIRSTELIKALANAIRNDGALLRMGTGPSEMELNSRGGVNVTFKGTVKARSYQFVAGADGIGSRVREIGWGRVGGKAVKAGFPGWGSWMCTIGHGAGNSRRRGGGGGGRGGGSGAVGGGGANPVADLGFLEGQGATEVWLPGRRIGAFPLPGGGLSFFATINSAKPIRMLVEGSPRQKAEAMAQHYSEFRDARGGGLGRLIDFVVEGCKHHPVKFSYPAVVSVDGDGALAGRAALLGDSARAILPTFLGQGPGIAVEDGASLAKALVVEDGEIVSVDDMAGVVAKWKAMRDERSMFARGVASELAKGAQHETRGGLLGGFVDAMMPIAAKQTFLEPRVKKACSA